MKLTIPKLLSITAIAALLFAGHIIAGDYDDYSTHGINEGAIGSGYDDYSTSGINEGCHWLRLR